LTVLIADDNALFATALQTILGSEKSIRVVGHGKDGEEAAQLTAELTPDVVLMDLSMPIWTASKRHAGSVPPPPERRSSS
jgi:DNA-binding NarL/FixJ family response regulator